MDLAIEALHKAQKEVENKIEYTKCGRKLYHYTIEDGMKGILGSEGIVFHFSNANGLEDTSEGKELLRCYDITCKELLSSNCIDREFFNRIIGIKPYEDHLSLQLDSDIPVYGSEKSLAYICCLTTDGDSSYMWENYSKNNGYSLMFDDFLFERSRSIIDEGYSIRFNRVFYEDEEKKEILKRFIRIAYKFRNKTDFKNIEYFFRDLLDKLKYVYKEQDYSQEKEIRAFMYLPYNKKSIVYKKLSLKNKIKENRNIRYVTIGCEHKIYFEGITVLSEENNKQLSKSVLDFINEERGYGHIQEKDIRFSNPN